MSYIPSAILGTTAVASGVVGVDKMVGSRKHHHQNGPSATDMIIGSGLTLASVPLLYGMHLMRPSQRPKLLLKAETLLRNQAKASRELGDQHLKDGNVRLAQLAYDHQNALIDAADQCKAQRAVLEKNSAKDKHVAADQSPIDEALAQHRPEASVHTNSSGHRSGESTPGSDTPAEAKDGTVSPNEIRSGANKETLPAVNAKLAQAENERVSAEQAAHLRQTALMHEQNGNQALADTYHAAAKPFEEVNSERRFTVLRG